MHIIVKNYLIIYQIILTYQIFIGLKLYLNLLKKYLKKNPLLNIYQAVIYDEDDKEIGFNITNCDGDKNNQQSSSILDFGGHEKHHPQVKVVDKIKLKTSRMDTIIEKYNINMNNVNFINLDIQGVELHMH